MEFNYKKPITKESLIAKMEEFSVDYRTYIANGLQKIVDGGLANYQYLNNAKNLDKDFLFAYMKVCEYPTFLVGEELKERLVQQISELHTKAKERELVPFLSSQCIWQRQLMNI
jgi:hypothetical protein